MFLAHFLPPLFFFFVPHRARPTNRNVLPLFLFLFSSTLGGRYWPQAVLGLTFNWGALLGWAAAHGSLDYSVVVPLYAGGVAWTLVYDTVYAVQDMRDDAEIGTRRRRAGSRGGVTATQGTMAMVVMVVTSKKRVLGWSGAVVLCLMARNKGDQSSWLGAGVKSTALRMGDRVRPWLTSFAVASAGAIGVAGMAADATWPFYLGVGAAFGQLM